MSDIHTENTAKYMALWLEMKALNPDIVYCEQMLSFSHVPFEVLRDMYQYALKFSDEGIEFLVDCFVKADNITGNQDALWLLTEWFDDVKVALKTCHKSFKEELISLMKCKTFYYARWAWD